MSAPPVLVSPSRLLDHRLEELVAAELDRLSRRAPALADDHLGLVEASLQRIINRLLPARGRATVRPNLEAESITQSQARPYRYVVSASQLDNEGPNPTRQPTGQPFDIECKVLILAGVRVTMVQTVLFAQHRGAIVEI